MKTTIVEVPLSNNDGKVARLELDHDSRDVKMTYTGFKTPVVHLGHLERALRELGEAVDVGPGRG